MPWKRIALIIGFIALVIALAILIIRVFFTSPPKEPPPKEPEREIGLPESGAAFPQAKTQPQERPQTPSFFPALPLPPKPTASSADGGPVQTRLVEKNRNLSPHPASDGTHVVTFDEGDGFFYRITPQGIPTPLSDKNFRGAQNVIWNPSGTTAVIQFPDATNIVYDFQEKRQITLPNHWDDFSFSPAGDKLIFKSLGEDPDNRWLAIANKDGSGSKPLEALGDKAGYFIPHWSPSGQVAAMFREGLDFERQKIYFIGLNNENFKALITSGRGFESVWSPFGDRLLHSVYSLASKHKPELWVVDAIGDRIGENRRKLNLQTWAHKCAFADNTTIYCAVPTELREGAGLFPRVADIEEDHIYRIDLKTDETRKIAQPSQRHTIEKIIVTKDQKYLYFLDKFNRRMYSIEL